MSAKADGSMMATKAFHVLNELGLHARPAAVFVKTASRFTCDVFVQKDGEKVNGKSIIGLLLLAAGRGSQLTVYAQGHDAALALTELEVLFERRFGETEHSESRRMQLAE